MADFTGDENADNLFGTADADILRGLGGNDVLDGWVGADLMEGGDGNDRIVVRDTTDEADGGNDFDLLEIRYGDLAAGISLNLAPIATGGVIALGGGGTARGFEGLFYVRATEHDDVIYLGPEAVMPGGGGFPGYGGTLQFGVTVTAGAGNDVLIGSAGHDELIGNDGDDAIAGHSGNDSLSGGSGRNELIGGTGNDLYFVSTYEDSVVELADEGLDEVIVSLLTTYTLPTHVERLIFQTDTESSGIGNAANNYIRSGTGGGTFVSFAGDDTLDTRFSSVAATLLGGSGDDFYMLGEHGDTVIELPGEGYDTITTYRSAFLTPAHVEALIYIGTGAFAGYGNEAVNIIGSSPGGATLFGFGGNDRLSGGPLASTLIGGTGDDTYFVGSGGDTIVELAGEGIDNAYASTLVFALPAHVENLEFNLFHATTEAHVGYGNDLDNMIIGSRGPDTLFGYGGNDTLAGHRDNGDQATTGANTLIGGVGNDTYVIKLAGDSVVELAAEGVDTVNSELLFYRLPDNVENLTNTSQIQGRLGEPFLQFLLLGNELDNVITGGGFNDEIHGYGGNDRLIGGGGSGFGLTPSFGNRLFGGTGDDVYVNPYHDDLIYEAAGEGIDTVELASGPFTLPDQVENFVATGPGIQGDFLSRITGNASANRMTGGLGREDLAGLDGDDVLIGGAGRDVLRGGTGQDTLTGGADEDLFFWETSDTAIDTITDFTPGMDIMYLQYAQLGGGVTFYIIQGEGPQVATHGAPTVLYNRTTGLVSFDADGTGSGLATPVFQIAAGLDVTGSFGFY